MTEKRYSHDGITIIDHLKKDLIYIDGKENLLELAEYVDKLQEENEQLKQFKDKVFKVIDEKIIECEKAVEEIRLGEKDSYIVKHDVASKILKELKKELTE